VLLVLSLVFALAMTMAPTCAITGCELHHPVDVTPDYPPGPPLGHAADASKE
jgi:hypothetical protein